MEEVVVSVRAAIWLWNRIGAHLGDHGLIAGLGDHVLGLRGERSLENTRNSSPEAHIVCDLELGKGGLDIVGLLALETTAYGDTKCSAETALKLPVVDSVLGRALLVLASILSTRAEVHT